MYSAMPALEAQTLVKTSGSWIMVNMLFLVHQGECLVSWILKHKKYICKHILTNDVHYIDLFNGTVERTHNFLVLFYIKIDYPFS